MDKSEIADGIREAVFGANDGAVSTFGILSGLVGAATSSATIILVGLVQMFAAGMSMGLGAYISTKSQNEFYEFQTKKVRAEIHEHPVRGKAQLRHALAAQGLSDGSLDKVVDEVSKNGDSWTHFLVEERFGVSENSFPHPVLAGSIMFVSFIVAGLFPLFPFFFLIPAQALPISAILALSVLFFVGWRKTRFTNLNPWVSGAENLFIGAITGVVGFVVGSVVKSLL